MNAPPTLTELKLTPEMKQAINTAFETGRAVSFSYVDDKGAPHLSYRGSTQAYSDTQLAIWVRSPEGLLLPSIKKNPAVALIYGNFDPKQRGFMMFRGRARVDDTAEVRRRVYEAAHELERDKDKDRKGVALIIDLNSVEGFFGGARLQMSA
jgi:general stress protein 26